ncbi:GRP1-like protein [Mya arenaria]|uniref:GRP1-like protein n=1 Tax=Mya arenaria TaxID=6604 RepID=A0ABY7FGJ8_MYAAR|nr:GRP1-like protein [Mya arenaria]
MTKTDYDKEYVPYYVSLTYFFDAEKALPSVDGAFFGRLITGVASPAANWNVRFSYAPSSVWTGCLFPPVFHYHEEGGSIIASETIPPATAVVPSSPRTAPCVLPPHRPRGRSVSCVGATAQQPPISPRLRKMCSDTEIVLRYWIRNFPVQFDLDTKLQSEIKKFGSLIQRKGNSTFKELVDLSKVPSYDWMRSISVRNPSMRHNRKVSLVFNHLEPEELADHLTYLEYRAFRRINFTDFKNYAMTASLKDNPKLERSIALFNGLSQWIQCMVLSKTTPQQRADVIVKFCNVAKMLMEYTELLSSNNNFSNYRKVFHQCSGFKIPILGVHLKDLILLHTALPDRPSTPTKPVVFAEWVAGMRPPDPQTINKHVHDMVEAVFKNYDNDRDGFISHAEFEAIAGNFPFIDSFCVLDADQDGMISKAEMKTYFIRANCHALRNSFKHDFHEITYFKPTFCIHCTGLLWGLIKQGWKCKDCGINAHKHCKDLVVMECRSKASVACNRRLDSLSSNGSGSQDLSYSSKRKMSQRQKRTRVHRGTQTEECYFVDPFPRELEEGGDFRELHERLLKAEEARNKLKEENAVLKMLVKSNDEQISLLRVQLGQIQKNTISFILEQMDALHIQRDSRGNK